ncbi:MAG: regulatory protein RecX [Actinomycetota bacterium]|nr:MAG: regulatory protein RecX [Actinomycetota bacterium]
MPVDQHDGGAADLEAAARTIVLQRLTASAQTRAQLEATLARRGVRPEIAKTVLDRLTEVGLVDDVAFAHAWVQSRHAGRGLSARALEHELRQRGIPPEVITEAVATVDSAAERQRAADLVARVMRRTAGLAVDVRRRRLTAMLARKGYPPAVAYAVVHAALRGQESVDAELADPEFVD